MAQNKQTPRQKAYEKYAQDRAQKSKLFSNCCKAFAVGGLICCLAQGFLQLYLALGLEEKIAKMTVPVTLVFIAAILTGIGVFDKIAKHAGAGTLVPITGFANAVVAPAIDNKTEGLVLGVGAKIFIIAGPVILYGTISSCIYGIIYYIFTLFG